MSIAILLCVRQTRSERSGFPPKSHFTRPLSLQVGQAKAFFYGGKICLHSVLLGRSFVDLNLYKICAHLQVQCQSLFFGLSPLCLLQCIEELTFFVESGSIRRKRFSNNSVIHGTETLKGTELYFIKANNCLFRLIVDNLYVYKSRKAYANQ